MSNDKSDTLTIKIERSLKKDFFDTCRENDLNPSQVVRRMIKEKLEKFKQEKRVKL